MNAIRGIWRNGTGGSTGKFLRRAVSAFITMNATPSNNPGMTPPRNK